LNETWGLGRLSTEASFVPLEIEMMDAVDNSLRDGTLVRHKTIGYEGRIEGTTAIKTCFTRDGKLLGVPTTKEAFQYRVAVSGQSMRLIAPVDDLEILEASAEIVCIRCSRVFRSNPTAAGKVSGRCACGGWICPLCLGCQADDNAKQKVKSCINQRKRLQKKLANENKKK
jgi:hypothetical protein